MVGQGGLAIAGDEAVEGGLIEFAGGVQVVSFLVGEDGLAGVLAAEAVDDAGREAGAVQQDLGAGEAGGAGLAAGRGGGLEAGGIDRLTGEDPRRGGGDARGRRRRLRLSVTGGEDEGGGAGQGEGEGT